MHNEPEEKIVISLSNTSAEPDAMMIELVNAVIAYITVV
jgi:hypothetical protein